METERMEKKMKKSKNPIGNFKEVKKHTSTHTEGG